MIVEQGGGTEVVEHLRWNSDSGTGMVELWWWNT